MKLDWHREYVGGLWDEIGRLQFEFLRARGLKPAHRLFDVACGSLRAGVHFIPYLNADRYFGLDRNSDLIQAGTERELNPRDFHDKRPNFVVSGAFEFEKFGVTADIALAQSLFTHLRRTQSLRACESCVIPSRKRECFTPPSTNAQ